MDCHMCVNKSCISYISIYMHIHISSYIYIYIYIYRQGQLKLDRKIWGMAGVSLEFTWAHLISVGLVWTQQVSLELT